MAGVDVPLVKELAADIFTGEFSPPFFAATRLAVDLLAGSVYGRYYDLDPAALDAIELSKVTTGHAWSRFDWSSREFESIPTFGS